VTYRNYTLKRNPRDGNYTVTTPNGTRWAEIAANVQTAKKWVDADLAEKRGATA
jgi:hypothetical protein